MRHPCTHHVQAQTRFAASLFVKLIIPYNMKTCFTFKENSAVLILGGTLATRTRGIQKYSVASTSIL